MYAWANVAGKSDKICVCLCVRVLIGPVPRYTFRKFSMEEYEEIVYGAIWYLFHFTIFVGPKRVILPANVYDDTQNTC